jgi:hypothetical protein
METKWLVAGVVLLLGVVVVVVIALSAASSPSRRRQEAVDGDSVADSSGVFLDRRKDVESESDAGEVGVGSSDWFSSGDAGDAGGADGGGDGGGGGD